jgi:hypothetical protein
MEDDRAGKERRWQRCYEGNRVEEELWQRAFELIWPLVRRAPQSRESPALRADQDRLPVAKGA